MMGIIGSRDRDHPAKARPTDDACWRLKLESGASRLDNIGPEIECAPRVAPGHPNDKSKLSCEYKSLVAGVLRG
jgi:hypothetical protein